MFLARYAEGPGIDRGKAAPVRRGVFELDAAQWGGLQTAEQAVSRNAEVVDREPWKHAVPDIQALRHPVEADGYQGKRGRARLARVLEGPFQKLVADPAPLLIGRHE